MRPSLETADADVMLAAARAKAESQGWKVSIAVVDESGALLALTRLDGAALNSPDYAIRKARSAALFRRPTTGFQNAVRQMPELLKLPDAAPWPGGVPVLVQGECVGAVGVSGAMPEEDDAIAVAGVAAVKG
jgi:glc operon protein GlcG